MGICMSVALCIGIFPVTAITVWMLNLKSRFVFLFSSMSLLLTTYQFLYDDALNKFEKIPSWLIITTGVVYSLFLASVFKLIIS